MFEGPENGTSPKPWSRWEARDEVGGVVGARCAGVRQADHGVEDKLPVGRVFVKLHPELVHCEVGLRRAREDVAEELAHADLGKSRRNHR